MNVSFNTATQHHPMYAAYLVRLWQETPDGPWRASAQSVHSGEVVRFGSLEDLFSFFLMASLSSNSDTQGVVCTAGSEMDGTQDALD